MKMRIAIATVAAVAGGALGQGALFYLNPGDFARSMPRGKVLKGIENFDYSTVAPGNVVQVGPSLQFGVPAPAFPTGLSQPNLAITSAPGGMLVVVGAGFSGLPIASPAIYTSSPSGFIDIAFFGDDKTAIEIDLLSIPGGGVNEVTVFDTLGNSIGFIQVGTPPSGAYLGFSHTSAIGGLRIVNLGQLGGVDNIRMYVPAPGSLALIGLGGLAAARRRR